MRLICPSCEAEVPEELATCPACGEPLGLTIFEPGLGRGDRARRPAPARPTKEVYARFLTSPVVKEPIELEEGQVFRIGRSRQSEVCFPSSHVSRLHAEVVYLNGGWVVGDLGSKNGTWVNGERIYRHALRDGDRIAIGHFELMYQELNREETFELLRRRTDTSGEDTAPIRPDLEGFYGDLAKLSIVEVVQLINQNRKTGFVEVEGWRPLSDPARLWFQDGEVVHARCGTSNGEPAVMRILALRLGRFRFQRSATTPERSVHTPTSALLLNALSD